MKIVRPSLLAIGLLLQANSPSSPMDNLAAPLPSASRPASPLPGAAAIAAHEPTEHGSPAGQTEVPAPGRAAPLERHAKLRVGLTTDRARVVISCPDGFRVTDPATGRAVWKESYKEPLTIGIRGGRPTEGRIYRAQVGSFGAREAADELAARLRVEIGEPVLVAWVPDRRTWRVRVGAEDSKQALASVISRLRNAGFPEVWIGDEPVPQTAETSLVLLDPDYNVLPTVPRVMVIEPASPEAFLAVDGNSYRGILEVRLDASGATRVINVVPVESYLRGVVPAELGPSLYPEIEALKAQAVAARTYVYRNLGQFADEGFDLCDTPRCQVYSGVKAEHPLSDRAVQETEGEIALFGGRPIDALYTSTCGGHTEDASEIFPEQAAPYLTGVLCAPEERSRQSRRILLDGMRALREAPAEAAHAAALLAVHGLVPRSVLDPAAIVAPVPEAQALEWIDAVALACGVEGEHAGRAKGPDQLSGHGHGNRHAGRTVPTGKAGSSRAADPSPKGPGQVSREARDPQKTASAGIGQRLAALARKLIDRLGWGPRIDLLVGHEEALHWLPNDEPSLTGAEIDAVAYFLRQRAWPEGEGGGPDVAREATRGDLARLLVFAATDCDLLEESEGIVRGGSSSGLRISGKEGTASRVLAAGALLFGDFGGGPVPVARLAAVPGDKVRYHLSHDGSIDFLLLVAGRQGVSDDRFSGVSSWQVAYSAKDLGKRLEDYIGPAGDLVDLVPVRRGVSGRVTKLKVIGTMGERTLSGFDIRTALGLKENLFVISRQTDRKGAVRRIVFTGRGWGHGVGMCQVGAYGMALRGSSYKEILTHYYPGITLESLP